MRLQLYRSGTFADADQRARIVHDLVNAGRLLSLTAIVEKSGWFRESWTEEGTLAECLQDVAGWNLAHAAAGAHAAALGNDDP